MKTKFIRNKDPMRNTGPLDTRGARSQWRFESNSEYQEGATMPTRTLTPRRTLVQLDPTSQSARALTDASVDGCVMWERRV